MVNYDYYIGAASMGLAITLAGFFIAVPNQIEFLFGIIASSCIILVCLIFNALVTKERR